MQGADNLNIESRRFFQEALNLHAIFAYNAEVVAARLAGPVLVCVQGAEFAEAVGGKENLVFDVVGNHDLRPVNHRCGHKLQCMRAKI